MSEPIPYLYRAVADHKDGSSTYVVSDSKDGAMLLLMEQIRDRIATFITVDRYKLDVDKVW